MRIFSFTALPTSWRQGTKPGLLIATILKIFIPTMSKVPPAAKYHGLIMHQIGKKTSTSYYMRPPFLPAIFQPHKLMLSFLAC